MKTLNYLASHWLVSLFCCFLSVGGIHVGAVNASDAPGVPYPGKVAFIIGQDTVTLGNYKSEVLVPDPDFPQPAGITLYTGLVSGVFLQGMGADPNDDQGNLLPGFNLATNDSYDFGGGFTDFSQSLADYPDASVSIGLYISDSHVTASPCTNQPLRAISAIENAAIGGDITPGLIAAYETAIDVMIDTFKQWDRVVYLRIGYEFDGSWNCYNTGFYIDAFRYIATRINELNASKVATIWQAAAYPQNAFAGNPEYNYIVTDPDHYDVWYPGDEFVDFVGLSTFYGGSYNLHQWSCSGVNVAPRVLQDRLLDFARAHNKPVMIAEAAPQAYETDELTATCIFSRAAGQVQSIDADTLWTQWYMDWFDYIEANSDVIRVVAYINADWDTLPTFACRFGLLAGESGCASGVWGDSRVQANPTILDRFKTRLQSSIYNITDNDDDGVLNDTDNCTSVANPGQQDTDFDGHGNICDGDFNNDCVVNSPDLSIFKQFYFSAEAETDLNSDGVVNSGDLGIFKKLYFGAPGPSTAGSLCNP